MPAGLTKLINEPAGGGVLVSLIAMSWLELIIGLSPIFVLIEIEAVGREESCSKHLHQTQSERRLEALRPAVPAHFAIR